MILIVGHLFIPGFDFMSMLEQPTPQSFAFMLISWVVINPAIVYCLSQLPSPLCVIVCGISISSSTAPWSRGRSLPV